MNRRGYFRNIVGLGVVGLVSTSLFKWLEINKSLEMVRFSEKRAILAELVEMIIPTTDTPGAKAAGVHDFIIRIISNCNSSRQQHKFITGIKDLEEYSIKRYSREFLNCNRNERVEVLNYFANNAEYSFGILNKINNKIFGAPFYVKLKTLTVEGYCCSQIGATEGLAYDYIPILHQACVPLLKNQKSWATK